MYEYLLSILSALVLVGLIFFIITNAFATRNYKMRALIFFLVAIVLLLGCVGGYFYDISTGEGIKIINYIIFPGAVILVSGVLIFTNLIKAKRHHHHLRGYRHRQVDDIEQYLYIVYKVNGNYYLKLEEEQYQGDIYKFARNIFFHDEMLNRVLEDKQQTAVKTELVGVLEMILKKKRQYFCYKVELSEAIDGFSEVNQFEIGDIKASELDKQIILRIVIGEQFNIKV